jgi:hypothetical protein
VPNDEAAYGTFHIDMNTHLDLRPGNTPTAKAA